MDHEKSHLLSENANMQERILELMSSNKSIVDKYRQLEKNYRQVMLDFEISNEINRDLESTQRILTEKKVDIEKDLQRQLSRMTDAYETRINELIVNEKTLRKEN